MARKTDSLTRRLSQVERAITEHAERERLTACNCLTFLRGVTIVWAHDPESFEKEMTQICPVHGFRRLGKILFFHTDYPHQYGRADELLDQYNARLKAWEAENDEEEF